MKRIKDRGGTGGRNLEFSFSGESYSTGMSDDLDWPDAARVPVNRKGNTVRKFVWVDLKESECPTIIAGYASLTQLIDFVVDDHSCKKIQILFGNEPFPSTRKFHSNKTLTFSEEATDYWVNKGISLRLSAKVVRTIELIQSGVVDARIAPSGTSLHAKIYLGDNAVTIGSSNFTQRGLYSQLEANVRFQRANDKKRYAELEQVASNYWSQGEDFCDGLIELLEKLLKVVDWQEALARSCTELLEGEWAKKYLDNNYLSTETLWPSQRQGIAQALYILANQGSVLIADATGSGKTKLGVHLVGAIQDEVIRSNRLRKGKPLLIAPPLVKDSWEQEIAKSRFAMSVVSHGRLSNLKPGHWEREALQSAQVLCVDEGHNFLNSKTNRTQALFRNIADHVVLFTATPINRGVRDLLQVADLLGADNLQESTVESFRKLLNYQQNSGELTAEDVAVLRTEIQRFTVRRTKRDLNKLIEKDPELYISKDGRRCRFPKHKAQVYPLNESKTDCEIAAQIRALAGDLHAVSHFEKDLRLPDRLRKQGWTEQQYLDQRLGSAKSLATYAVMSSLRSSRAALLEHIVGTKGACKKFGIKANKSSTGDMIARVYKLREKLPKNHLKDCKLPGWLTIESEHLDACENDLGVYRKIKKLTLEMSSARDDSKADLLIKLHDRKNHVLAFDSRPISLMLMQKVIRERQPDIQVLLAFGDVKSDRLKLMERFSLESEESGVIGLCSDSLSEGVNLQKGKTVVHLDMPSVIRIAEQRVGRVDRIDSPYDTIDAWWPDDAEEFRISSDDRFVERYETVESLLGSNMPLPAEKTEGSRSRQNFSTEQLIEEFEREAPEQWDGINDAFYPVRGLVEGEKALISAAVYKSYQFEKYKVLCRVSLVKSRTPWAFFCMATGAYGAPRWLIIDGVDGPIVSDLSEVAAKLRALLVDGVESLPISQSTAVLIERFSNRLIQDELDLLPRKKRGAYTELLFVMDELIEQMGTNQRQEELEKLSEIRASFKIDNHEFSYDWDSITSKWLDIVRPTWFEKLRQPRDKPLLLKDIRNDLIAEGYKLVEKIIEEFSDLPLAPRPEESIQACIIGVG